MFTNCKRKKGNATLETLFYVILIVVFAIAGIIGYKILGDVNDDLQDDPDLSQQAKDTSSSITARYPAVFDGAFVFLVLLAWGLVIVASFQVDAHPIFFVFTIILMTFVLFIGAVFSNFYSDISTDDDLGTTADNFPKINWIMEHLIHLIIVVTASVLIALYGKNQSQGI